MSNTLVLPRPGSTFAPKDPIPGSSESAFTTTFGKLLPPAQYLQTDIGKAAYYVLPPTSPAPPQDTNAQDSNAPRRVLLIHGVQTPALGMLPLTLKLQQAFPSTEIAMLDLWGHGLSDTPVQPHEGPLFHRLIDSLLTHLGWLADDGVGLVGFSFGAVLTMGYIASLAAERRGAICSYALVAPAGLVRKAWFTSTQRGYLSLDCAPEDEAKAAAWVESVLEGGERRVPEDWQDRVSRGQVVAEALREWQVKHHAGHSASVTAIFRDGGVTDNDELYVRAKGTGVPSLVVLGADDDLSTEKEISDFGFDVRVVKEAGHSVVRDKAGEVAECIAEFWRGL